ncbi:MAG: plasmid stabilization protein [Lutibacter sp.]|nr:plasmid stabilization protein [Lutibacter sp.]
MKVVFLNSFKKDLIKISNVKLKGQIKEVIIAVELAESLAFLPNVKKMQGYSNAYRIRIGDYRLGLFIENGQIEMVRLVKRNDIYKVFP